MLCPNLLYHRKDHYFLFRIAPWIILKVWRDFFNMAYSYLPNKRGGLIKRGGWKDLGNRMIGEGSHVPNKRGGWKIPTNTIKGEG